MASQNHEVLRRLKSDHYLDNIGLLFKSLYSNDNLADVTISCRDGPTIEAHKIVLSACSSYFHELLSKKTAHPVFIMHKISYQDMLYLLEFMYKGVIDVPEDSVDHLIQVAKELEIIDFYLPENNESEPIVEPTSHEIVVVAAKKRKLNLIESSTVDFDYGKPNQMVTIPEIDVVSLNSSPPNIRKSLSERSSSDVNENQTSTLSRNTRFKGKKRVPVCETIDVVESIDLTPLRSTPKKKNNHSATKNHAIHHSTPHPKDLTSSFIIRDVSGANGSIVLNYNKNNGKDTSKSLAKGHHNRTTTSPPSLLPRIPPETLTNFTVKDISPEDILEIETVTPDITIDDENSPISPDDDDGVTEMETGTSESKPERANITNKEDRPAKFQCDLCRKSFYRESQLHKHRKTHSEQPIRILFPCKKCDEKFSRLDKLKIHVQNYHDDDDYVPKGEKKKRLYGNPIEASPTELQQIEHSYNPTSATQSIIQSIKSISTLKMENVNDSGANDATNDTNDNLSNASAVKRGRGRPPKEKPLIVKPRGPKGRPRKYFNILNKQADIKPVGRPRKSDGPIKLKVIGRKPGRPRKSEQGSIDENHSRITAMIKSDDNYDGASLPYGDLSYLTSGLINNGGDESTSTNLHDNPPITTTTTSTSSSSASSLSNQPITTVAVAAAAPSSIDGKNNTEAPPASAPTPPPLLTPNEMTLMPKPIKSECDTTITPLLVTPPPTLEPIIPFQNENITITQIPPLIYIKPPSVLNAESHHRQSSALASASASSSMIESNGGTIHMKQIGDCTIRPLTSN